MSNTSHENEPKMTKTHAPVGSMQGFRRTTWNEGTPETEDIRCDSVTPKMTESTKNVTLMTHF